MNRYLRRDIAVVRKAYEEAPKDVEWPEAQGVKFVDQPVQGTGTRKRVHYFYLGIRVGSSFVIKTMKEQADSLDVKILYNTSLFSLLTKNKELFQLKGVSLCN